VSLLLVNLDWAAASCVSRSPSQAIGRDRRSTPFPSSAIYSGRLFLSRLLASIARLRFTDDARISYCPIGREDLSLNGNSVLTACLSRGGRSRLTYNLTERDVDF
jgi:hypothetical protein